MNNQHTAIQSWVIVGGGTAGWMSAALLSKVLFNTNVKITLIESPDIGTVGVGEATVPSFVDFIRILGISEQDFVKSTQATFKLGIKFTNWKTLDHEYWHPFGNFGAKIDGQPFFQHWLKSHLNGNSSDYANYAASKVMADQGKFYIPDPNKPNNLSRMGYALHFDAGLVAKYLANFSQQHGVNLIAANVDRVNKHPDSSICSVTLANGQQIQGDFFIDCTGQNALLLGQALNIEYCDWQHFLPVNSAAVVQSERAKDFPSYTESIAHEHGWRWRIPLQQRTGNGYVFCDQFCNHAQAIELLLKSLEEKPVNDPRIVQFTTGKRDKMWHKNCVAIGLSSGFLEPLESTSIYLIMRAALNLIKLLPDKVACQATENEYNRLMDREYEHIRDFIIMHYCTSQRSDTPFWQSFEKPELPSSLQEKLTLYRNLGRLTHSEVDLFASDSWYAVLTGMGVFPRSYDPVIDASDADKVQQMLTGVERSLEHSVGQLLSHQEYISRLIAS